MMIKKCSVVLPLRNYQRLSCDVLFQQVDGFLRRAFFACKGKLHCLVSADLLDYEVGEQTEKKLNEYMGKTGEWHCM